MSLSSCVVQSVKGIVSVLDLLDEEVTQVLDVASLETIDFNTASRPPHWKCLHYRPFQLI